MYQSFYGFREMPFNITPDPRFLYLSPTHQEALQHLKYGVREKKGFIVLIGEVGCGKTTLCRKFLNDLDPTHYDTALILNPRVTETQMLKAILTELGETKLARSQNDLVAQVNRVLLDRIEQGRDIVLIIDEAQNLKFEVLEQIRLLSNLEIDKQKLLQIVLMGQPELKDVLARNELRQLRQRILVHYELHPLSATDMAHYIQHRLALAGGQGRPGSRASSTIFATRRCSPPSSAGLMRSNTAMPGGRSGIWRISPAKRYPTRPRKIFQGCRTLFQSPPDRPNSWPHESDQRSPQESEAAAARRSHRPRSARSRRRNDHPAGAAAQCEIADPDFSRSGRPRRAFGIFYRLPRQPRGSAAAKSYEHKAARAEN